MKVFLKIRAVITLTILLNIILSGCFVLRRDTDTIKDFVSGCQYRCTHLNGLVGLTIDALPYKKKAKIFIKSEDKNHISSVQIRFLGIPNCLVEIYPDFSKNEAPELPTDNTSFSVSILEKHKIARLTYWSNNYIIDCLSDSYIPTENEKSLAVDLLQYLNKPLKDFLSYLDVDSSSVALSRYGGTMFIEKVIINDKENNRYLEITFWHDGNHQSTYKKLSELNADISLIVNYNVSRITYYDNNSQIECKSNVMSAGNLEENCFHTLN